MRAIVAWSLNFRFLVVAVACALMAIGLSTVRNTPVDVFPEFAPPQVSIQTESLGLSTSDVEKLVTVPLELAMNGMPGLTALRSTSVPQLSSITLVFSDRTNLLHARQLVQERLSTVRPTLPRWASPPVMLPPVSATARVLQIGMTSDTLSTVQLSQLAYWNVKARLLGVEGVADVSIWNERPETLQVQVDPVRMAARKVTLDDVQRTTSDPWTPARCSSPPARWSAPAASSTPRPSASRWPTHWPWRRRNSWPRCRWRTRPPRAGRSPWARSAPWSAATPR